MWFGTQYGLNRYDGYKFKVFAREPGRSNSLSGVFVRSLFKDREGTLWVGCDQFLDKFDPVTETFTHYSIKARDETGPGATVMHMSQDRTWSFVAVDEKRPLQPGTHQRPDCALCA